MPGSDISSKQAPLILPKREALSAPTPENQTRPVLSYKRAHKHTPHTDSLPPGMSMLVHAKKVCKNATAHSCSPQQLQPHHLVIWHVCNSSNAWAQAPAVPGFAKNRVNVCSRCCCTVAAYATAILLMLCFCCPLLLLGLNRALTTAAGSLRVAGTLVAHGTDLPKFTPCEDKTVKERSKMLSAQT